MATYLITGGCGFIGSHLAESLLKDNHKVRIIDNLSTGKKENVPKKCEIIVGDITDSHLVKQCEQGVDGIFHLAAVSSVQKSIENWRGTHEINQTGTINILDAARERRVPVVYASSAAVYGDNADMPLKEISSARPLTAYGADKMGSELHARVASLVFGVPTVGMRFFNVYGPRQDPSSPYSGVISIFIDRILEAKNVTIFGDGEQNRDFVYVTDVVRFLRSAMNNISSSPAVYNVCTGRAVSINQLAKTLMSITGNQISINYNPQRQGDIRVSIGDPSMSNKILGLSAKYRLIEGLNEFFKKIDNENTNLTAVNM